MTTARPALCFKMFFGYSRDKDEFPLLPMDLWEACGVALFIWKEEDTHINTKVAYKVVWAEILV